MSQEVKNNFSVGLGLFDYINPIFYTVTSIFVLSYLIQNAPLPFVVIYGLGAIISLIFGFSIPTVKLLVGLGKMKFEMPVNLVFYVNTGIFISGISLFTYVLKVNVFIALAIIILVIVGLFYLHRKLKKFNTIAVLIGAVGYILIYSSLIVLASFLNKMGCVLLYSIAILLFVFLVCIGIFANLKDSRVHWVIEISNVICQGLVALSTIILVI